ncbi:protein lin-54 homolog [Musca vetustissima]|uniref:protein lin-54 homolog n=1 Tax=Musca vetustissima TaxID=27455 RepID=UPI002AB77247|nr:protein lin-54 homolog [Musca vetustissima]
MQDSLDDSSSLPELSFDDLLDTPPTKKNGKPQIIDEDSMEYESEEPTPKDDTLNTPVPKKTRMVPTTTKTITTNSFVSNKPVPIRTNLVKTATSNQMTAYTKNSGAGNTSSSPSTSAPILLNTKNVLPKMAAQITNHSIKLTPKTVSSTTAGSGGGVTSSTTSTPSGTSSSFLSIGGKTAVRTASGQLLYIQKTTTPNNTTTTTGAVTKLANTSTVVKTQQNVATTVAGGNKPVTIQVMRNADGNLVPIKTSTGPNGKNTTLTLSPTASLAGKKIISSTGGKVLIKTTSTSGMVSTSNPAIKTMVVKQGTTSVTTATGDAAKPKTIVVQNSGTSGAVAGSGGDAMGKPKTFVVQSNNGKILVTNQNLVKLSPKPATTGSGVSNTTTLTSTTNNNSGGQHLQAVQIPGKSGVQYVRVVPQSKSATTTTTSLASGQGKLMTMTSVAASTSSLAKSLNTSTTTSTSATKTLTTSAPVKILNNLPQKFTVVQKGGSTKVVVTQKKDANGVEFTPIASKVQKTIVAMPTTKATTEDGGKQQEKSPAAANSLGNQTIIRKHKISEINTELKRITASETEDNGPPEVKKPTPNSRVVVIASNAPTILNSGVQQQIAGRVVANPSSGNNNVQVQGTRLASNNTNPAAAASTSRTRIAAGDKMYTLLKPSSGQQNPPKVYSVLKASQVLTTTTTTQPTFTAPAATQKLLLNQQSLVKQEKQQHQQQHQHQQQTVFSLKQLQPKLKSSSSAAAPSSSSSSSTNLATLTSSNFSSIKIKEEPLEDIKEDPNKIDLVGAVRRKHCNCSKSQCLKLYCDCFANGEFCQDCTCKDCCNNLQNEDERQRAIRSCLERNPSAFKPKITSSSDLGDMRLHNKGCNCKRSGCLKNYCECYEAKIPCSSNCKCVGCRNVEDRPDLDMDPVDPKVMATIANASGNASTSQKRSYDKRDSYGNVKTEKYGRDSVKQEYGAELNSDLAPPEKQQCNFITQEVVDATIQCMVTQADECEKNGLPAYQMEKMVMEELGRCLVEIIDFSIRNTDTSYTQD